MNIQILPTATPQKCRAIFLCLLITALCLLFSSIIFAEDKKKDADTIHILSDSLISDSNANTVEFGGNVRVTQGNTIITSERLKVIHKGVSENKGKTVSGAASIEQIIAEGNVRITFDDRIAQTQKAIYKTEEGKRIIILSGSGSKITIGKNSFSGSQIIIYPDEERIEVKDQAEVHYYPQDE